MTGATLDELRRAVLESESGRAHPDICARLDDPDAAEASAVAVVAGETKRGKSSLVNALLRRPGLFPVDVDIATSCYLGATVGPSVRVTAYGDEAPDGTEITPAEIASWASVEGNRIPGSDPPELAHPGVTAVTVELPHPLLAEGLTVVDTPGVGGLEAGHTEITMAILRRADSLLFVVDPDSGLRKSELIFLAQATGRVAQVAFVMTKIDRYAAWREVLDENISRLGASAPAWKDSPWFAVSSLIAYDAADAAADGNDAETAALWSESGFDRLESYLRSRVAGRGAELRLANGVHRLRGVIDALEEAERLGLAAAGGDPGLSQQLAEQQAALSSLLAENAKWPSELAAALDELKRTLQRELRARLRALRGDMADRVAAGELPMAALRDEIDAGLRGLWLDLNVSLRDKAATVLMILAGDLASGGSDVLAREVTYPERLAELPDLRTVTTQGAGVGDMLDDLMPVAFSAGGTYTLLAVMVPILSPLAAIALGMGAGMARRNAQAAKRARTQDRTSALAYLGRVLEQAADDISDDLARAVTETRDRCEHEVRSLMTARRDELETPVRSLKQQVRAGEAEVATARAQVGRRLAELTRISGRLPSPEPA
jgi:Dynamin family